jgi:hypothetical protein
LQRTNNDVRIYACFLTRCDGQVSAATLCALRHVLVLQISVSARPRALSKTELPGNVLTDAAQLSSLAQPILSDRQLRASKFEAEQVPCCSVRCCSPKAERIEVEEGAGSRQSQGSKGDKAPMSESESADSGSDASSSSDDEPSAPEQEVSEDSGKEMADQLPLYELHSLEAAPHLNGRYGE